LAILKVIEIVGTSPDGWEAAARAAVAQASRTLRHVESLEVLKSTARVNSGDIIEYRLHAKLTFRIEDDEEPQLLAEAVQTILAEPMAGDGEELPPLLERQIDEALEEMDADPRP